MLSRLRIQPLWQKLKQQAIPILIVGVGLSATAGLVYADRQIMIEREQELATETLYRVRSSFEEAFYRRFTVLVSLEALVQSFRDPLDLTDPDQERTFRTRFERFTIALNQQVPGIMSMQLAPEGIVNYVSNLERNRSILGYDLLQRDELRDQMLETIERRSIIVAGPTELRQGGEAIIARQAIFTEPGAFNPQRYVNRGSAESNQPCRTYARTISTVGRFNCSIR